MSCVRDTVSSKGCWTVLMSSRVNRTSCKFDIWCWKVENKKAVNIIKLTEKKTADSARRHWGKSIYNFLTTSSKKKLPLPGTQIAIATMSDKQSLLPSVSVLFISVLSSVYHLNSMIHASSFVLLFKTGFISTSDWSLCLLWDAVDCCPCVSVEEQNSSADQIKDAWHISNESQLQLYVQQES